MGIDGRIDLGLTDATSGGCCGGTASDAATAGACCTSPSDAGSGSGSARPEAAQVVLVDGMTCGHCVSAVTEELSALPGVAGVDVELNAGGTSLVTVHAEAPLDRAAVDAAVAEAGYAVAR